MDYELIRAYCAKDLNGILQPRDEWYSTPESRWDELEHRILLKHRTGARYLEPRQYAAAVCMRALEILNVPYQADGDYPEFTQADSIEVSRVMLANALNDYIPHLSASEAAPLLPVNAELQQFKLSVTPQQTAPATDAAPPALVTDSASTETTPDPERRLARLRALGGDATFKHGKWRFAGIVALEASEQKEGRPRNSQKTIREDLQEAAESERVAKRAGFGSGLGQR